LKTGFRALTLLSFALAACSLAPAQAIPAASRPLTFSGFGGLTGTYTGLGGGKNLGITAGADLGWKPFHRYYPSVEVRGTYPVDKGKVDSQENILFGLNVARFYGNFHPYGDFLYGRAKVTYASPGYPNPTATLLYLDSVTNVFSFGGGLDYTLTDHFALKIDGQFQRYSVPVTTSGTIYSKPITVGVVYRFGAQAFAH
jgi:opacity protein-like surface antigen